MRALIVGAGAMGRWFAECTAGWLDPSFADVDRRAARRAADAFDGTVADIETDERFPVVCSAVPMASTEATIADAGARAEQAFIDVSGSMAGPLARMREHAKDCERISLHPLFAPENAPGNVPIVVENGGDVATSLRDRLDAAGYEVVETTAEEHDRAMENVQAKAHAAVLAYALAAEPVDDTFHTPVSARLEEVVELVLSGTPHVYADIQDRYVGADGVAAAAGRVAETDGEAFHELYRSAAERHDVEHE